MQRIAFAAVVGLLIVGLSPSSRAQSSPAPATQRGFSFCTVHDVAGHKVWASPVFEVEYPSGDPWTRTREMATEFHNLIGSMGGAGDKECASASIDRAAIEGLRASACVSLSRRAGSASGSPRSRPRWHWGSAWTRRVARW